MIIKTQLFRVIFKWLICLSISFAPVLLKAQEVLVIPVWDEIFDQYGNVKDIAGPGGAQGSNGIADYIDIYGAADAVFAGDNLSNSSGTDMSVSDGAQDLESIIVRNDTVIPAHDLGNGFVMAKVGINGDLMLYGGIERLASNGNSYIEFEFNQGRVQAVAVNTALKGERTVGDLLVRLNLQQGVLTDSTVKLWNNSNQFVVLDSVSIAPGITCNGDPYILLACDPWQVSGQHDHQTNFDPWTEGWDLAGNPISVTQPNALLEFAVNVAAISGSNPEFSSIVIRTPQDITLASFSHMGYWAQANYSN